VSYPPAPTRTVLVTGASSGIGRATACLLRDRGWTVYPTARRPEDLDALRAGSFDPIPLDLDDPASVAAAASAVLDRTSGRLGALVNNAGYGQPGALEDVSRDALRRQFETNVVGPADLTARLIPAFRAQRAGRIVFVSSVVGRVAIPFMGAYCASKYAVEALGDEWRMELAAAGISVSLIEPGPIATSFRRRTVREARAGGLDTLQTSPFARNYARDWRDEERTFTRPTDVFRKPPEAVAQKILHALESRRPRAHYPVTLAAHLGAWASRHLPTRLLDALMTSKTIGRSPTR
jgi:NAD(P)-dependent dehydrogenase (short-subunit alcohol dehydrogenase family)